MNNVFGDDIIKLKKGLLSLKNSYSNVIFYEDYDIYTSDDLDKWEILTARFARLSDLVIQKLFTTIMLSLEGYKGTLIDKANYAEKIGVVEQAKDFTNLKYVRNFIAHEYTLKDTNEVFEQVYRLCPLLIIFIERTIIFCEKEIIR